MPVLKKKQKQLTPARTMILSFAGVILLGAFLLCLPISSKSGHFSDFVDCLFTATSATCVTGITVFDTYNHFNYFGQGVILMLIQVGGLGFLTFVTFFNIMLGKKLGWSTIKNVASDFTDNALARPKRIFGEIVGYTFCIELAGAALLCFAFVPDFGAEGVYISIFMAVSAFCNAGFDLLTVTEGAVGVSNYIGNPIVMITLMLLIIIGGLGFIVWQNIRHYNTIKRLYLHTKVVLITSGILILVGAVFFFFSEFANVNTMHELPLGEKILSAFFMSVSSRTAGISCFDIHNITPLSKIFTTVLMFIGAAPASTGGGIKVTTIAILIATVLSVLRGEEETHILKHRLKRDAVFKTLTVTALSLAIVMLSFTGITLCSVNTDVQAAIFDVVSGFSTTGFALENWVNMNVPAKLIMVLTMLTGRVGPVTLMLSLMIRTGKSSKNKILPQGDILVG